MNSSKEVIEACLKRTGKTRHAIAAPLGAQPGQIYGILAGKRFLSKSMCTRAAEILECEPAALYAIACAERETDRILRESLLKMARAALTAAIVVGISAPAVAAVERVNCILCQVVRRRRFEGLAALSAPFDRVGLPLFTVAHCRGALA